MDLSALNKDVNETEMQYIWRIGRLRETGVLDKTWAELANLFNSQLREPDEAYTDSAYRKKYSTMRQAYDEVFNKESTDALANEIRVLKRELEKEKVNIRDERNEYKKLIREEARKESYIEQVIRSIKESVVPDLLEYDKYVMRSPNEECVNDLVIPLYDIHAGLKADNWWNSFDENILKDRFNYYLKRIFEIQQRHNAECAHVEREYPFN